jgi:hypothetical protein
MAFWNLASVEPKRNFRYKVTFGGSLGQSDASKDTAKSQISMFATEVKKPSWKMETKDFQYLNHTFKYPGRVKWEPSSIKFVDAGGSSGLLDIAQMLVSCVVAAGYQVPKSTGDLTTISKSLANAQVGLLTIEQINAQGSAIETWTLYNAMFTDVGFSTLSYTSEELSDITVGVVYDYATILVPGVNGGTQLPSV